LFCRPSLRVISFEHFRRHLVRRSPRTKRQQSDSIASCSRICALYPEITKKLAGPIIKRDLLRR
jgi:hypothetical protein